MVKITPIKFALARRKRFNVSKIIRLRACPDAATKIVAFTRLLKIKASDKPMVGGESKIITSKNSGARPNNVSKRSLANNSTGLGGIGPAVKS